MSITYDAEQRLFSLRTKNSAYQMQVDRFDHLLHLYYGRPNVGFISTTLTYFDRGFSGNPSVAGSDRTYSLDMLPQEYPCLGPGDYRHYALNVENGEGTEYCSLFYSHHRIIQGKYSLPGLPAVWADQSEAETLEIVMKDPVSEVEVTLLYGVLPELDIITRSAVIKNGGNDNLIIKKAAAATLDFVTGQYDFISFYGRHAMERQVERVAIPHGIMQVGSRRGTSSHEYNPAVILSLPETCEESGECWGMAFVFSGNFLCEVELDQYDQTRITMGLNSDLFEYPLGPGEELTVPEVIMAYSRQGFSKLSNIFQKCIRNHVCRGKYARSKRPVLVNSWEAAYFNFTGETIVRLAEEAQPLGIDMVVMDDGWFGNRNDDNSSLGDWKVNEAKLGCSLPELVEKVNACGVEFGIWIEPEMVNEDSDLYRQHPDWVIKVKNRPPVRGRNQLLLDFSRPEVRDHIFAQICEILDSANIQYVKWDMNRSMADVYDGALTYDYVVGLYDFLEKLIQKYPDILIEGCSGGGGRFDAGMLYYTPQIWCSDNTDAINRTKIQYGTSFFYPLSAIASHVSAVPNHQTGRVTSLSTRGVTAMTGAFGYELDLSTLGPEAKEIIRQQVATFKKYEELISEGNYYRLANPFKDREAAWMSVTDDRRQALLSVVRLDFEANMPTTYIRMMDLDADALYIAETDGRIYTGAVLMEVGMPLPFVTVGCRPEDIDKQSSYQIPLRRMDEAEHAAGIIARKAGDKRLVVGIHGCSGSGKTTLAQAIREYLQMDGVQAYVLSGDDYVHRYPIKNDEERERIFNESGRDGLREYLGTSAEIDFGRMNQVLSDFHAGKDRIMLQYLGIKEEDLKQYEADFEGCQVLLVEWTHAGSADLFGMDMTIFIEGTPEETLARRVKRGRNLNAASELIRNVLEIEQERLERNSLKADIVIARDGSVHER